MVQIPILDLRPELPIHFLSFLVFGRSTLVGTNVGIIICPITAAHCGCLLKKAATKMIPT